MSFLERGPKSGPTFLFAHGAGIAMDAEWMEAMSARLAGLGLRIMRFEFAYMAARREGKRKPPPAAEMLIGEYRAAIAALGPLDHLVIGGKSMGGRIASMIADEELGAGRIAGLVCLGYPFHPTGKAGQLRVAHLETLRTPTLICQGTRDPFGSAEEVATYLLSSAIRLHWLEDGDHDFKPRKTVSGLTHGQNLHSAAQAIASFVLELTA